jgi:hypothetical protein
MDTQPIRPKTLEEQVVHNAIIYTWVLWLFGAIYVVGAVIGYLLLIIYIARALGFLNDERLPLSFYSTGLLLWPVGMLMMLLALVVGHLDFGLGMGQLIKSVIGWGKGWALLAVVPLAGALLSIRPAIIYRATGRLALQTLVLVPFFLAAGFAGLPKHLYVSPLSMIGGPGSEFFDVTLYAIDDTDGSLRWRFFGPWATASAFVASIGLFFALYEKSMKWKLIGFVSTLFVCWMAGSRSSIVAIPVVLLAVTVLVNLNRPVLLVAIGFAAAGAVLFLDQILVAISDAEDSFNAARASSSRVRDTLNDIGYHRWYSEAFWFGHGVVERGPHLVHFMPIGSHHTWYGLLYVKGLIGFLALAIPFGWSVLELTAKAQCDRVARSALCILLAVGMFSFADNLEIVTYLIWPGLLIIGIGLRRPLLNPYRRRLGDRGQPFWDMPSEPGAKPLPA